MTEYYRRAVNVQTMRKVLTKRKQIDCWTSHSIQCKTWDLFLDHTLEKKKEIEENPGMIVHTCNHSTGKKDTGGTLGSRDLSLAFLENTSLVRDPVS